ncbi:hypothetical protein [Mucilaginibacter ginkgonis]|uniref:Transcriptional regulator n=1 Tax=Mucilaginibacter ginkgonis TaxID=2682091 RepID=A0A6I4I4X7_9SPHI|nr:hypothetical protein [Mucilaginibacter ginkgonis]QQL50766.1 hypothetical protein GO620_004725 [Mucilaginibacter ginkgonis]
MALTDEEFREEYKPLHIPAHFEEADTEQNRVIYALAQLGEGTSDDVINKLKELQPGIDAEQLNAFAKVILRDLFNKGKLAGNERDGKLYYNLHKITRPNSGATGTDYVELNL